MKKHEPTIKNRNEVSALKSFGVPEEEIAAFVGIPLDELQEIYRLELETSSSKANAEVGRFLFSLASGRALKEGASYSECSKVAMFWARSRMNWREGKDFDFLSGGKRIHYPTEIHLIGQSPDDDTKELDDDDESN